MKYYTIKEVAELSGKSQKTIRRYIASNALKSEKVSNKYRIYEDSFNEWIKSLDNLDKNYINNDNISLSFNLENLVYGSNIPDKVNYIDISDIWNRDYWINKSDSNGLNFIDLFAGAGGMSLGFVMAGYTPIASVEINQFAVQTYFHNFVNNRGFNEFIQTRDIREDIVKQELYDIVGDMEIDVICCLLYTSDAADD